MLSYYDIQTLMKNTTEERLRQQALNQMARAGVAKCTAQRRMEREIERFVRSQDDADIVLQTLHQVLPRGKTSAVRPITGTSACS